MKGTFNKYIWKIKIDVSKFCGEDSHFIQLREPNTAEYKQLMKIQEGFDDETDVSKLMEIVKIFSDLTNTLIVDHDFYDEEDTSKKLAAKDVSEFIDGKIELAQHILIEYCSNLPLLKGNKEN